MLRNRDSVENKKIKILGFASVDQCHCLVFMMEQKLSLSSAVQLCLNFLALQE